MKSLRTTRPWALALAILVLLAFLGRPLYADPLLPRPPADSAEQKIAPGVSQAMDSSAPAELIPVIITLKQQADLGGLDALQREERIQQVVQRLQDTAAASQGPIRAYLASEGRAGNAGPVTPFWVFNGLAVPVAPAAINQLAARPDVLSIAPDATFSAPSSESSPAIEPNLTQINAPALWDLGFRGQSIVVATMDTGVDGDHPDLVGQWRGGTNSWFDPNGQHPDIPYDASGHGTQSMGVIVGGSAGGSAIGVAPDAQWIAVKIFDDAGSATSSGIHLGFQWLLDPDGDPSTSDAPHVINNSWNYASPGCILDFQLDLQALRAAGVLPVFAAGNAGPFPSTSVSPANNPEAFAVGAVDISDYVYYESSRGPSACEEGGSIFPEVVAPGVNIYSSDRHGLYSEATGTSLSAPHVSGGLALLLSAYPDLSASAQESALLNSVLDLGPAGPDNDSGYGRLDLLAAYQLLEGGGSGSTPTPTPPPPPQENLALNKPVTVSSFQDEGHNGQMAVDGLTDTTWQTKKATGKKTLPSEWIKLDLGSNATLSGVVLQWDTYYATAYTIAVSADDQDWSTLFTTTSADGETDTVSFQDTVARYVMLDTTEWVDGSKRNWLKEFEVYGTWANPQPTVTSTPAATATATPDWTPTSTATPMPTPTSTPAETPTPTPTATSTPTDTPTPAATDAPSPTPTSTPADTPTPTPTATATATPADTPTPAATEAPSPTWTPTATPGAGITVHVGDLDDASFFIRKKWWEATVDVTVHDGSAAPLAGAVVSGIWSDGASGSGSCLTDGSGLCTISLPDIKDDTTAVTFTVVDVSAPGATYEAVANHDPDGDSDGTTIVVTMP